MNEKVIIELIMQLLGCQCNGCTLRSVFVHAIEMFISLCMRFELMQTWMLYNNISFFVFFARIPDNTIFYGFRDSQQRAHNS